MKTQAEQVEAIRVPGLWMLEHGDAPGEFCLAIDGADDAYLAFLTEEEAVRESSRQNEMYDIDTRPVRVQTLVFRGDS